MRDQPKTMMTRDKSRSLARRQRDSALARAANAISQSKPASEWTAEYGDDLAVIKFPNGGEVVIHGITARESASTLLAVYNASLTTLRLCRTTQAQTIAKLRIQLSEIVTVLQKFQSDCPLTDQMSAIIDAALAKAGK